MNGLKRKKEEKMSKYDGLTQEIFADLLETIVHDMSASEILAVPDVYSCMVDELNNEVLDLYETKYLGEINDEL
jgi:hypothetical protein